MTTTMTHVNIDLEEFDDEDSDNSLDRMQGYLEELQIAGKLRLGGGAGGVR